jgi:hypothetical protein
MIHSTKDQSNARNNHLHRCHMRLLHNKVAQQFGGYYRKEVILMIPVLSFLATSLRSNIHHLHCCNREMRFSFPQCLGDESQRPCRWYLKRATNRTT